MAGPKPQFPNVLTVRVDNLMLRELEELAKFEDRDVSWIIRKAIEQFIENHASRRRRKRK
jgi:predicted transcriptional regulator